MQYVQTVALFACVSEVAATVDVLHKSLYLSIIFSYSFNNNTANTPFIASSVLLIIFQRIKCSKFFGWFRQSVVSVCLSSSGNKINFQTTALQRCSSLKIIFSRHEETCLFGTNLTKSLFLYEVSIIFMFFSEDGMQKKLPLPPNISITHNKSYRNHNICQILFAALTENNRLLSKTKFI